MDSIKFNSSTTYWLSSEEIKRMYLAMALFRYEHYCTPDYDSKRLLFMVERDFSNYIKELSRPGVQRLLPPDILNFFETHVEALRQLKQEMADDK